MIGFIKWLMCQYKCYKLEKIFKNDDDKANKFMNLFSKCNDYGFTHAQVIYILDLVDCIKGE